MGNVIRMHPADFRYYCAVAQVQLTDTSAITAVGQRRSIGQQSATYLLVQPWAVANGSVPIWRMRLLLVQSDRQSRRASEPQSLNGNSQPQSSLENGCLVGTLTGKSSKNWATKIT